MSEVLYRYKCSNSMFTRERHGHNFKQRFAKTGDQTQVIRTTLRGIPAVERLDQSLSTGQRKMLQAMRAGSFPQTKKWGNTAAQFAAGGSRCSVTKQSAPGNAAKGCGGAWCLRQVIMPNSNHGMTRRMTSSQAQCRDACSAYSLLTCWRTALTHWGCQPANV